VRAAVLEESAIATRDLMPSLISIRTAYRSRRDAVMHALRVSVGRARGCQREAAYYLGVSARYLRDSDCPKVLLPGNGKSGQPIVRYDPVHVKAWGARWNTKRVA
jgi:hypothetical protein